MVDIRDTFFERQEKDDIKRTGGVEKFTDLMRESGLGRL